jgi:hypothetical protein
MAFTIPPRPATFDPEVPPPGVELRLFPRYAERPKIKPRSTHAHTNGASVESTLAAQYSWTTRAWGSNTMPHFLVDRSGNAWQCLPTNRKGIGSTTVKSAQGVHGNVADWTIVIETTDTGTNVDPTISAFTDKQAERLAVIFAYLHMTHAIPLEYPTEWWGAGTSTHTEPFGYPYTTLYAGKICPGTKKKKQVRELVLPRAREIVKAWSGPVVVPPPTTPTPPPEDINMAVSMLTLDGTTAHYLLHSGGYKTWLPSSAAVDAALALARLEGRTLQVQHFSKDARGMFEAFGPILGPGPGDCDAYGWPKA